MTRVKIKNGRKYTGNSIYWDGTMLGLLKRYYPYETNKDVTELLGISERTLRRKAKELGLEKDEAFMVQKRTKGLITAAAINRRHGNPGMIKPGEHRSQKTEFSKTYNRWTIKNDAKIHTT